MTTDKLLAALRQLRVETGSLICLGCGHEHSCGIHGCAILRGAADLIEQLEKEKAALLESVRGGCISCKHWAQGTCGCTVAEARARADEDYKCKDCDFGKNWEWKGLEELLG